MTALLKSLPFAAAANEMLAWSLRDNFRGRLFAKILTRCVWVDRGSEYGPCLEWQGPTSGAAGRGRATGRGHSYPRMTICGCTAAVHRVVWITLNGYLPTKKQLDHLCKNRKCVLHCEPVTHKENQRRRDGAKHNGF